MDDLFANPAEQHAEKPRPLADRLRPKTLAEVVGQGHLLGADGRLTRLLKSGTLPSLIFWGPPGCGKTTIAKLLAAETGQHFESLSAIFSGVGDLKTVFQSAKLRATRTLLFVDEIHRFNRAQQDAFLPFVEDGTITLVGATTENPSFALNAALLSRCAVLTLKRLETADLDNLLDRAEQLLGPLPLQPDARGYLSTLADGDGRYLLSLVEQCVAATDHPMSVADVQSLLGQRAKLYDKDREEHYNLISALHKSVRGSDPDAALYWFCRMLEGGEDPRYLARRMVRMAAEDIGLASPQALQLTIAAWETYERLGSPEGELALCEALLYLATCPKSNASYAAYNAARAVAKDSGSLMPPKHILNAPTKLMKEEGYGAGYVYDPATETGFSGQNYFPDELDRMQFYAPKGNGFEGEIKKRLDEWTRVRAEKEAKDARKAG